MSLAGAVRATLGALGIDHGRADAGLGPAAAAAPAGLRRGEEAGSERGPPEEIWPVLGGGAATEAVGAGWAFRTPPRPSTRPPAGSPAPARGGVPADLSSTQASPKVTAGTAVEGGGISLFGGLFEGLQHSVGSLLSNTGRVGSAAAGATLPVEGITAHAANQGFGGRRPACRGPYPPSSSSFA